MRPGASLSSRDAEAKSQWLNLLSRSARDETLFELETLLAGFVFRLQQDEFNGSDAYSDGATIGSELTRPKLLSAIRDGVERSRLLIRLLLEATPGRGELGDSAEDLMAEAARSGLIEASPLLWHSHEGRSPQGSLSRLLQSFNAYGGLAAALLALDRSELEQVGALLGLIARELSRDRFFSPAANAEMPSEIDKIQDLVLSDLLPEIGDRTVHRAIAQVSLTLARFEGIARLLEASLSQDPPAPRYSLLLSTLHGEVRLLRQHLCGTVADELAGSFRNLVLRHHADTLEAVEGELRKRAEVLAKLSGDLSKLGTSLDVQVSAALATLQDGSSSEPSTALGRLGQALVRAQGELLAAIVPLTHGHGHNNDALKRNPSALFDACTSFSYLVRAFEQLQKNRQQPTNRWQDLPLLSATLEMYFYAQTLGYPLLREISYPRIEEFIAVCQALRRSSPFELAEATLVLQELAMVRDFLRDRAKDLRETIRSDGGRPDGKYTLRVMRGYFGLPLQKHPSDAR